MKVLLVLILAMPALVFAEKKMTAKDMSMLGKIDESNFKEAESKNVEPPHLEAPKKYETKAFMTCKEEDGREFKQGEVGYDNCLNGLRNRSEFSKRNSGVYGNDKKEKSGAGAGINFKIGE